MESTALQMQPEPKKITLDPQQAEAAFTDKKDVLCLAGAGSGKTRVIVERIGHLIEDRKVSPHELVAFTFTRKAAGELRKRIEERIGNKARHITIGTIHGVAFSLLRRFGDLLGYKPQSLTVYGEWEEQFLLREVARDLGVLKGKSWKVPKKDIDRAFQTYYTEGIEPEEDNPARALFNAMLARCRENNALTYGMILTQFVDLLPLISKYLNWKHIFLDEAQDTDLLQWHIIDSMQTLLGAALFAVGDIDQSIYSWRGAVPEYLLENQDSFTIYKIENNYRSYPEIVNSASNLIAHNQIRFSKTMRAARTTAPDNGRALHVIPNRDSAGLARLIRGILKIGAEPSNRMAVLARNHFLLDRLSEELTKIGVSHQKIGRVMELTRSEEFRRFHAFLKLLVNPYDNFAFLLIKDFLDVDQGRYNQVRYQAAKENKSHFRVWKDSQLPEFFSEYERCGWTFSEAIITLAISLDPSGLGMKPMMDPIAIKLVERFCLTWAADNPNGTLAEYLAWLATYDLQDEIPEEPQGLQLMTVHASKGLEFPIVFVAGCNEGLLPSKRAAENGDIEEERRLMYVAMTRAEDLLVLTVRPERTEKEDGRVYESPVSRFIGELQKDRPEIQRAEDRPTC